MDNKEQLTIKWCTPEDWEGIKVYAQHAFVPFTSYIPYLGDEYIGNKQLCTSRRFLMDGDEKRMPFEEIEDEDQHSECCKHCLRISKKFDLNTLQK